MTLGVRLGLEVEGGGNGGIKVVALRQYKKFKIVMVCLEKFWCAEMSLVCIQKLRSNQQGGGIKHNKQTKNPKQVYSEWTWKWTTIPNLSTQLPNKGESTGKVAMECCTVSDVGFKSVWNQKLVWQTVPETCFEENFGKAVL